MGELIFLKLGGSLLTDKQRKRSARLRTIRRLASEIRAALAQQPGLRLVMGHGSGSFGHMVAARYGTQRGVHSAEEWAGFAQVAAAAAQLNQIVTDIFAGEGLPVLSLPPSASARCEGERLNYLDTGAIHAALRARLIPLVYGDVAFDSRWGGTIISTEKIFAYLSGELRPKRILLAGSTPGVYADWPTGETVVPLITPDNLARVAPTLAPSADTDVTGGMADKVQRMLALVEQQPSLSVHIFSGLKRDLLRRVLLNPQTKSGTRIKSIF